MLFPPVSLKKEGDSIAYSCYKQLNGGGSY
jgi:hypothetical protein